MNFIKTIQKLALITIIAVALQLLTTILFTWTVDLQYGDSNMIMMLIAFSIELIILALGVLLFTWKPSNPNKKVWTKTAGIFLIALAILGAIYTIKNGNQSLAETTDSGNDIAVDYLQSDPEVAGVEVDFISCIDATDLSTHQLPRTYVVDTTYKQCMHQFPNRVTITVDSPVVKCAPAQKVENDNRAISECTLPPPKPRLFTMGIFLLDSHGERYVDEAQINIRHAISRNPFGYMRFINRDPDINHTFLCRKSADTNENNCNNISNFRVNHGDKVVFVTKIPNPTPNPQPKPPIFLVTTSKIVSILANTGGDYNREGPAFFENMDTIASHYDTDKTVYVANKNSISIIKPGTPPQITTIQNGQNGLPASSTNLSVRGDRGGNVYVGVANNGLFYGIRSGNTFNFHKMWVGLLPGQNFNVTHIVSVQASAGTSDPTNLVYMATNTNGVLAAYCFIAARNTCLAYMPIFSGTAVNDLALSARRAVLIATNQGLHGFIQMRQNAPFIPVNLPQPLTNQPINTVTVDQHLIYVGTKNDGLYIIRESGDVYEIIKHITHKDGLSSNDVKAITVSPTGDLYLVIDHRLSVGAKQANDNYRWYTLPINSVPQNQSMLGVYKP